MVEKWTSEMARVVIKTHIRCISFRHYTVFFTYNILHNLTISLERIYNHSIFKVKKLMFRESSGVAQINQTLSPLLFQSIRETQIHQERKKVNPPKTHMYAPSFPNLCPMSTRIQMLLLLTEPTAHSWGSCNDFLDIVK